MPEAFAIVLVLIVAAGTYVFAWLRTSDPAHQDPQGDLQRLHQQHLWLQEHLKRAEREKWDRDMTAQIADKLSHVQAQLAKKPAA